MIKTISISNYAIIDDVELSLDNNLNIITGETGAGKSIILGALGLLMGKRADSKVLYNHDRKCIVEAVFTELPSAISTILKESDLDDENELIIRREIVPSGKSRAFVNDTPTTLNVLQKLSLELIDLNAQFQSTDIYKSDFYVKLIDAIAGHESKVESYRALYKEYRKHVKQLTELKNSESSQIKEMDFMQFQLKELTEADLSIEEQSQLESESAMLEKADDINTLIEETKYTLIDSDQNIKDVIAQLSSKWESLRGVNTVIDENLDAFSEIEDHLQSIYRNAMHLDSTTENDPIKLLELQDRLSTIYNLQKKHGVNSIKELLDISTNLQSRISSHDSRADSIVQLKKVIKDQEIELNHQAITISKKRQKVIPKIQKEVNEKMSDLAMPSAQILIECKQLDELRQDGCDNINMLFKANKGGSFQPIRKVASGGESSRLMLSLKSTVARKMDMPTMIFDEIDTGISGDVAGKIGGILKELSSSHQLICITHSPQVASKADNHFYVYKEDTKERTITHVKHLSKKEKIEEIAKMLSGDPPTTYAMKNAKELISAAQ
jgi:DNA repair protein RecN (Recombination protein N)